MSAASRDPETPSQHAPTPDTDSVRARWRELGQPWRTEPEIPAERQHYLALCRSTIPDVAQGIYPFKDVRLGRADVEWLLATQCEGREPVAWNDERHRGHEGLDLRGADLRRADLAGLPLTRMRAGLAYEEWPHVPEEQREQASAHLDRANLREASLEGAILVGAPLVRANLSAAHLEGASLIEAHLEQADLREAHLEGADLHTARLERAHLRGAYLAGADLHDATLEGADLNAADLAGVALYGAHLEGVNLRDAHLEGKLLATIDLVRIRRWCPAFPASMPPADLRGASLNTATDLYGITLGNAAYGFIQLADVRWGDAILTVVDWSTVTMIGDERVAQQQHTRDRHSEVKLRGTRLAEYDTAIRANRQLALVLRAQGLSEQAARFVYRAQVLGRQVLWWQVIWGEVPPHQTEPRRGRPWHTLRIIGRYLFSLFLDLVSGYGQKPGRALVAYLFTILAFAAAHYIVGLVATPHPLTPLDALAMSIQNLHGRIFAFHAQDPQQAINTAEAMVGLMIESLIVAVITRRILGLQ